MRIRSLSLLGMIALVLVGFLPGVVNATGRQIDGDRYESPQFGYVVEWGGDWAARERDSSSVEGVSDTLILSTNAGRLQVIGQQSDATAADLLLETVERVTEGASEVTIGANDPEADVPISMVTADNIAYQIELHDLNGTKVMTILSARTSRFDEAIQLAPTVTLNGTALFTGEPAEAGENVPDAATPDAEDGIGLDGNTFTSSYGFNVEWDEDWEANEFLDTDYEFVQLLGETGSLVIAGTSIYEGDAAACLEGEDAYYSTDDPDISDWEIAVDAGGDDIFQTSETFASGIFTYTLITGTGGDTDLVDYMECRTLVPGEVTMIVLVTSDREQFEDHLATALAITNAIEMPAGNELEEPSDPPLPDFDSGRPADDDVPDADATEEATEEPRQTNDETGESGLNGTTFTSPNFGFSLEIPEGWEVTDELLTDGNDQVQLSNGTSLITVRGTDELPLEPTACIGAVETETEADPAYADLTVDSTADGQPFQGADDRGAYALFTYTGEDGEEWAYFVRCEPLVADESVLVVVQDVPYDDYIAERQARRVIQLSIERP
jgi:hypothetical protein